MTVATARPQEGKPGEDVARPRLRGFSIIPDAIMCRPELTGGAKCVYAHLLRRAGNKPTAWPALEDIARNTGYTVRQARRLIRELEGFGLIRAKRRGGHKANHYRLLWSSPWWSADRTQTVGFTHAKPPENSSPDQAADRTQTVQETGHRRSADRTQMVPKDIKKKELQETAASEKLGGSEEKETFAHLQKTQVSDLDFQRGKKAFAAAGDARAPTASEPDSAGLDLLGKTLLDYADSKLPMVKAWDRFVGEVYHAAQPPNGGPPVPVAEIVDLLRCRNQHAQYQSGRKHGPQTYRWFVEVVHNHFEQVRALEEARRLPPRAEPAVCSQATGGPVNAKAKGYVWRDRARLPEVSEL